MKRIEEVLQNRNEHYLYPFFWQKGQSNEILGEYLDKMNEQGIYNACIESRQHPEFLHEYACIRLTSKQPLLTAYPYQQEDGVTYLFFNEDILEAIDVDVTLPKSGYLVYDAFENVTYALKETNDAFHLHLEPYGITGEIKFVEKV